MHYTIKGLESSNLRTLLSASNLIEKITALVDDLTNVYLI